MPLNMMSKSNLYITLLTKLSNKMHKSAPSSSSLLSRFTWLRRAEPWLTVSLPHSEDYFPLTGDIMDEKPTSNPDFVNVEEILKELRDCRHRNRERDHRQHSGRDGRHRRVHHDQVQVMIWTEWRMNGTRPPESISGVNSTVERNSAQILSVWKWEDVVSPLLCLRPGPQVQCLQHRGL